MKKSNFLTLSFMVMMIFVFGVNSAVSAKPKKLDAVSFLPKDHPLCAMIHVWVDRVNKECKEAVKINWLGGGEVIPGFDQAGSLQNNIVQIIFNPAAYYAPLAPEVK